jgi:hypothetical protein
MTHEISADWSALMQQAKYTAEDYFVSARGILASSGLEYTASDVIALAKVMADDFHTASISVAGQKISEALAGASIGICGALAGIDGEIDYLTERVTESIDSVGTSIDGVGRNVSSLNP